MRIEDPGSRNPVEHFLGRGEAPFVDIASKTKEIEALEMRLRQVYMWRIGDVSLVMKMLMYPTYQ